MIDPTLTNFKLLFPEFGNVPDSRVNLYLLDNQTEQSQLAWGRCYGKAVLYATAHELSLALARQASASAGGVVPQTGILQSGSEEGISFSFATLKSVERGAAAEWLAQTPYGQAYTALQRQCLSRGVLSW